MSVPSSRRRATSEIWMPRIRSMTMTSCRQRSQWTSGTCRSRLPAKLRLSCEALPASRMRSSSFRIVFSYSTTTSRGRRRRESGQYSSARPARARSTSRSRSIASRMPGRSTLTTTSRPSLSVAACTWAMEAAASGATSKPAKSSATGWPSEASMRAFASAPSKGGTRSWSFASSSAMSGGSRSRRVETTWPNFTKIGPSSSSARRRRSPRVPRRRVNQVQGESQKTKRSGR